MFSHKPHNKQENKPHSHKKKGSTKRLPPGKAPINFAIQSKESRMNYQKQMQNKKRQELINKRRGILDEDEINTEKTKIKIIALIPLNEYANTKDLQADFMNFCNSTKDISEPTSNQYFPAVLCPSECSSGIPGASQGQKFIFIACPRNDYAIMDAAKVADIMCVVMSSKGTDCTKVKLDPDKYCRAIDDLGYKHINMLRAQGLTNVIGVLQHLEEIPAKKQNLIKKFFQRYFESEFDGSDKFFVANKKEDPLNYNLTLKHMLRHFASALPSELSWRKHRSYFVVDKLEKIPNTNLTELFGYVRGNCFTTLLPIHITGYGNFSLQQIESIENSSMEMGKKAEESKSEKILQIADSTKQEPLAFDYTIPESLPDQFGKSIEELKTQPAISKVKMQTIQENAKEEENDEEMLSESNESGSEMSEGNEEKEENLENAHSEHASDKESENSDAESEDKNIPPVSKKHKRLTTLQERAQEDLEFPDEVDTPADQSVRERFKKYKGLKSMKSAKWDPYENLPPEYARLFEFKNPVQSRKLAIQFTNENGLKLNGIYTKITVNGLNPDIFVNHPKDIPIVFFYNKNQYRLYQHY